MTIPNAWLVEALELRLDWSISNRLMPQDLLRQTATWSEHIVILANHISSRGNESAFPKWLWEDASRSIQIDKSTFLGLQGNEFWLVGQWAWTHGQCINDNNRTTMRDSLFVFGSMRSWKGRCEKIKLDWYKLTGNKIHLIHKNVCLVLLCLGWWLIAIDCYYCAWIDYYTRM